jgi:hypothetical protein
MQGIIRKTFVLMLAAIVMTAGFGLTLEPASAATGPTSITIKAESGTTTYGYVDINGKAKVYVYSVYPSTRSKSVTWSIYSGSAYGKIASKTSTYCYIQGIKTGTVVLKAKSIYYPYATKYIKIYVRQLYPTGVTLSRTSLNMWANTGSTLYATVVKKPWVYSAGVNWTTTNSTAATVSTTGVVVGRDAGSTTVTATSKDLSTLKANCTVKVYNATLAHTGRISMEPDDTLANPMTVTGPDITGPGDLDPARTIGYVSSNPTAVSVDASGNLTAKAYGSATITATVSMPSITLATKTKVLKYVVNVKQPVGVSSNEFDFDKDWAKLEIVSAAEGFMGQRTLLFSKANLDDFFGFGALGVDLWNPMDMSENFFAKDLAWHIDGFTFDKVGNDVEVSAMIDQNEWFATYVLNATDSLDMISDPEGIYTGYDLKFFYDATPANGYDLVTLRGNVLTIPFGGDTLGIERLGYNKIQILADNEDVDPDVDNVILTITRNPDGYHVVINDTGYMTQQGITFNLYQSYSYL